MPDSPMPCPYPSRTELEEAMAELEQERSDDRDDGWLVRVFRDASRDLAELPEWAWPVWCRPIRTEPSP